MVNARVSPNHSIHNSLNYVGVFRPSWGPHTTKLEDTRFSDGTRTDNALMRVAVNGLLSIETTPDECDIENVTGHHNILYSLESR